MLTMKLPQGHVISVSGKVLWLKAFDLGDRGIFYGSIHKWLRPSWKHYSSPDFWYEKTLCLGFVTLQIERFL